MHPDLINNTTAKAAAQVAFAAVSAVQSLPRGAQVAGVALLLKIICDELYLDLSEMINKAGRMAADADTHYQREVQALRDYVQGELAP